MKIVMKAHITIMFFRHNFFKATENFFQLYDITFTPFFTKWIANMYKAQQVMIRNT